MTTLPSPVVRSLIVCESIVVDPRNENRVTLVNVVNSMRSKTSPPYPLRHQEFCVFVQLTECRQPGTFRIVVREADTDREIIATVTYNVAFPNMPLLVHGLRFRLQNCTFPEAGLYWIQFWYDNSLLASNSIVMR